MLSLANHANDDGEAWPSIETIAYETQLSERRVHDGLRRCIAEGWVERVVNGAPDKRIPADRRPNLYRLVGVDDSSTPRGGRIRRDGVDESGATGWTKRPPEPSLEPSVDPSPSTASTDVRADPNYRFDDWWALYPTRNGRKLGKKKAAEKWRRLSYDDKAACYAATKAYAAACARGDTIAKDAERFLAADYWRDWLDAVEHQPATPAVRPEPEADCATCDNQRWIEGADGRMVHCPDCRGSSS